MTVYLLFHVDSDLAEVEELRAFRTRAARDAAYARLGKWANVTGWEKAQVQVVPQPLRESVPARHDDGPDDRFAIYLQEHECMKAPEAYHRWYYKQDIWRHVSFLGVYTAKNVTDLWNYQEILTVRKPSLVVEFGTYAGGAALYFAELLRLVHADGSCYALPRSHVLTVDLDLSHVHSAVRRHERIELLEADSTQPRVAARILDLRREYPGPMFAILDSDHHAAHVFAELVALRGVTEPGDYVVVEDSNINGHPVLPDFGPGPWEAIDQYFARFPLDYAHDTAREEKFGFTFAPRGFLVRTKAHEHNS